MTLTIPEAAVVTQAADRVLVLAPLGRDATVVCAALSAAGIDCEVTATLNDLVAHARDGVGAIMLTQEALSAAGLIKLLDVLSSQPSWSDLPLVLLLAETDFLIPESGTLVNTLRRAANVTVLVRPVPTVALVTAIQSALRARARQYEVRDSIEREHAARLDAERANAVKDEFLATVSHELRTPLSGILLWSGLMESGRLDTARTMEAIQSIRRSAELQSRLVEDLLDVSRMLCGKLQIQTEEIELAPATEHALEVVRPMAQARNIKIESFIDPVAGLVRADPDRVQQVVWNLLGNAVKFTPDGGRVSIDLQREGDHVAIRVSDTGQGIAADFLPHVFDRFRQADAAPARRHGGLGLGLAITYQLMELHGGAIAVDSAGADRGTLFTVRFPLARVDRAQRVAASRTHADPLASQLLAGQRVLLVEDEAATRTALKVVLEHAGAEVIAVDSAAAALREVEQSVPRGVFPDVVLSDIGLPGEDGFSLIRHLREHARAAGRPLPLRAIAISAYTAAAIADRAIASGFQSYIAKPVNGDELIEILRRS
jgi:signal transduction histidine kinase/ActR/RegA family two-component response regulator